MVSITPSRNIQCIVLRLVTQSLTSLLNPIASEECKIDFVTFHLAFAYEQNIGSGLSTSDFRQESGESIVVQSNNSLTAIPLMTRVKGSFRITINKVAACARIY